LLGCSWLFFCFFVIFGDFDGDHASTGVDSVVSPTSATAERTRTLPNRLRGSRYPRHGCEGANSPDSLERGRTAASRLWTVRCRPRQGPNPCRSTTRSAMVRRLGQRWFGGSDSGGSRVGQRLPQDAWTAETEVSRRA